jgi:UDP-N-acetylglucosamine 4,6-dehydratase
MIQVENNMPELSGKSILVTGGTGSFGRAFIASLLRNHSPQKLIVFSRDEFKQYQMQSAPEFADKVGLLRFHIGDVRDVDRLEMAMREVDIVIHAAALKHVPIAEYNPFECVRTNVHGAENVVNAAIRSGVRQVIALSTDKAANPINLYGATKLASDKIFISANNISGSDGTRFSVVRYGNVVGSRGSVVPYFQRLVAEGAKSLPLTDPQMTRFWITLPQCVDFVLTSLQVMQGGELFVPKIPSMRLPDLANALAPELTHDVIGIRPGEKLHEVLITEDEARTVREFDDRYVITPPFHYWTETIPVLTQGVPVTEGFRYASDTNDWWLNADEISAMIENSDSPE